MVNKEDAPAPDSSRGFLAGGLSSSKSSLAADFKEGKPIVIFFFDLDAGKAVFGGGRWNVAFFEGIFVAG